MNAVREVHNSKYSTRICNVPYCNLGPETSCLAVVPLIFCRNGAVLPYLVTNTTYLPPLQFIINQSRYYSMLYYVGNWKPFANLA